MRFFRGRVLHLIIPSHWLIRRYSWLAVIYLTFPRVLNMVVFPSKNRFFRWLMSDSVR
jgi:hypothetical protein